MCVDVPPDVVAQQAPHHVEVEAVPLLTQMQRWRIEAVTEQAYARIGHGDNERVDRVRTADSRSSTPVGRVSSVSKTVVSGRMANPSHEDIARARARKLGPSRVLRSTSACRYS